VTNEQIEKRFLFDLEMGRFKNLKNFSKLNYVDCYIFENVSYKLIEVLNKLGYTEFNHISPIVKSTVIVIVNQNKHYEYWSKKDSFIIRNIPLKAFNTTPSYIDEYDTFLGV